ncbi:phosphopantothenoylcysteine decarboxylase domain-containing protein [Caproicibacter fermentans]|uniref:Phosphopantothenate--cysteine ligase n=1 Tax=Caproicibacter fermentans TaxID=2576756 RepID=A0A7G8T7L4_9FIRM|nr:phosphopantothenoylcysteine decarboxylase [Caproicibacter fermentans]QNK39605.1 phosphopantothenate--cysteine ligase [Caproicibacter fermentans]
MKTMKIIITAGGISEKIDGVRKITNSGTGRLGSLTAEELVRRGGDRIEKIYYVCAPGSAVPRADAEVIPVQGAEEANTVLERLLTRENIGAVIHSMAVSDYAVDRVTTAENLAGFLADRLSSADRQEFRSTRALAEFLLECINRNDRLLDRSRKVSSELDHMLLMMRRTPKLIGLVKALRPSAVLVGFKLLKGVDRQTLLNAGHEVMKKNSCDLVLANDQTEISGDRHVGYLLSPDGSFERYETKAEISAGIAGRVLSLLEKRERQ